MKMVCSYDICTGCALCASQCPKSCIKMEEGFLGHLFPVVNPEECIDCGLCRKICPSLNNPEFKAPSLAYASWAKDETEYKSSTSGGVASVLSRFIIENDGVVYGCAMLPDIIVKHIRVDNENDLQKLKGSKYVQSSIEEIIPLLKADVKDGRLVLFIGTPCQVAAISNIFLSRPENLFLVDIICHGVPSAKSLQKHIKHTVTTKHVDNIIFRDGSYAVVVVVENNVIYRKSLFEDRFDDAYINAFFDGFSYRDSCYHCSYARQNRISDITIGDFWGLGAHLPIMNMPEHNDGCSAVLINTDAGKRLIDMVKDRCYLFKRPASECVAGNEQLRHPKVKGPRIKLYRFINKLFDAPQAYYWVNADLVFKHKIKEKK